MLSIYMTKIFINNYFKEDVTPAYIAACIVFVLQVRNIANLRSTDPF